jgi:hypothetical protein
VDFEAAMALQGKLYDYELENCSEELTYRMFDDLDGAKRWKVEAGHKIRKERARRWFLNEVDTEVIEVDFAARAKTWDQVHARLAQMQMRAQD